MLCGAQTCIIFFFFYVTLTKEDISARNGGLNLTSEVRTGCEGKGGEEWG